MLLFVIITVLLFCNWFLVETLVYLPVNLVSRFGSFGWWALAVLGIVFLAWCIGEE